MTWFWPLFLRLNEGAREVEAWFEDKTSRLLLAKREDADCLDGHYGANVRAVCLNLVEFIAEAISEEDDDT